MRQTVKTKRLMHMPHDFRVIKLCGSSVKINRSKCRTDPKSQESSAFNEP